MNTDDTPKIIALLKGQVQDLKEQLDTATAEKAQLLELLSAEKAVKEGIDAASRRATEISELAAPACRCAIEHSQKNLA